MGLDDRLFRDQRRVQKNMNAPDPYYDSEPDWMIYKERERNAPIDREKGVFTDTDRKSLNKRPSIFDETAVFRTSEKKED